MAKAAIKKVQSNGRRSFDFTRDSLSVEKRTVDLAFSSEEPYERWYGKEILGHSKEEVDMTRIQNGASLLWNHDSNQLIGVVEKAAIGSDKVGRATVRFGNSEKAKQVFQDVQDGICTKVSVGYRINSMEMIECEGGDPDDCEDATYRATSWTPYELSMVSIPADDTVGVGRSDASESNEIEIQTKGQNMKRNLLLEAAAAGAAVGGAGGGTATDDKGVHAAAIVKSREEARKEEQDRCRKIISLGTKHRMVDEANVAVDKGTRYEEFSDQVLDEISKRGDKKDEVSEGADLGDFGKKSLGDLIIESDQYRALAKRGKGWLKANQGVSLQGEFKAPLHSRATLTQSVSGLTKYERPSELILVGQQPLYVAQLFAPGTTENTTVRHSQEDTWTNAATALAEEGTYQELSWDLSEVDTGVKKVGVLGRVTDEQLEDSEQIAQYVNNRVPFAVMQLEDQHCITGSGNANQLKGILNQTGILTMSCNAVSAPADAVFKAMTKVASLSFFAPDFILMNPFDYENFKLTKDSSGQYYAGGPFTGPYGIGGYANVGIMWGLPVVQTTAMTRGTAIVGAFRLGGQLWRRRGINVQTSNSDASDFANGRQALRADVRDILAVYRPAAFCTVTDIPAP